jgi:sialidase-1
MDLSNTNPVEIPGINGSAVLVHYDTKNNPSAEHPGRNRQVWSSDEGNTWVNDTDITHFLPESLRGCMPGPSMGIIVDSVVYFSCHGRESAVLYWSLDFGKSWEYHNSTIVYGLNECSLAEIPRAKGKIVMDCRIPDGRSRRIVGWDVTNVKGGGGVPKKYMDRTPSDLIDPECQGSVVAAGSALYQSNAANRKRRSHMTVKKSVDGGETWDEGLLIHTGSSGYSQLVALRDTGDLGLLFEADGALMWTRVPTGVDSVSVIYV